MKRDRAVGATEHHRGSHSDLLGIPTRTHKGPARPNIDAVIVPAARSVENLAAAAELAVQLGCLLVVLCSVRARGKVVAEELEKRSALHTLVIDFPTGYAHHLLEFLSSKHAEVDDRVHADLSGKRNVGLLLAHILGWRQILFLDDDIRGLEPGELQEASLHLRWFRAVGYKIRKYPDNSVVCHAHRLAGGYQDTFIGGSPLLVDVATARSFFPAVYNEDWLFLYDSLRERKVAAAGSAKQLCYDPYEAVSRAEAEEFGDLIGEGLLQLLHWGVQLESVRRSIWHELLDHRHKFIDELCRRLQAIESRSHDAERLSNIKRALRALAAAKERLEDIKPGACHSFVKHWRKDLAKWSDRILRLPRFASIHLALRHLDLSPVSLQVPRWRRVGR